MRISLSCLIACVAAVPAYADQFTLNSRVTTAELYPQGATITREVVFDLPAGDHELLIADLPRSVPFDAARLSATGVTIGSVTLRRDALPPHDTQDSPEIAAARAEVERIEGEVQTAQDALNVIAMQAQSAQLTLDILAKTQLTPDPTSGSTIQGLAQSLTIGAQEAMTQIHEAQIAMRPAQEQLEDLNKELSDAKAALAALQPEPSERGLMSVAVQADAPTQGTLRLTYLSPDAAWTPVYDIHLDRAAGSLRVDRSAMIAQTTDEVWQDVQIALSTTRPSGQVQPSQLWPWLRSIYDPKAAVTETMMRSGGMTMAAPPMAQADYKTAEAQITEGIKARYTYDPPVNLGSSVEATRISLGSSTMANPDIFARAVPSRDETAFMAAKLTNTSGEQILPAQAWFYLDGDFVGQRPIAPVAPGAEVEFSFGPIEGLQLRQIQRASEGDSGILRSNSDRQESVTYEVKNLTSLDWDVRMLAQVPYSEQDDLRITWTATPMPDVVDLDDQQGILEWSMRLRGAETRSIQVDHRLRWPEGMELN